MGRNMPWLVAAVCALVGVGVWLTRTRRVSAIPGVTANEVVRRAWSEGARVPLEGYERLSMLDAHGKPISVDARVVTSNAGDLHIEYLSASLKGAQVWENADRTYRYNPQLKRVTVARRRGSLDEQRRQGEQLLKNYVAARVGCETVAGHRAVVVELRPRTKHGRLKRVWVDPHTWAILASEDFTMSGGQRRIERSSRFTQVRYLGPAELPRPERFRPSAELLRDNSTVLGGDFSKPIPLDQLSARLGFKLHQPHWLPEGYVFEGAYETPCQCGIRHQAARLEYSDGLNRLSLFQCGQPDCKNRENCFSAHGRMAMAVRYESDSVSYLAVGDLPRSELERVVKSVEP